jgi:hypothetical protein
MESNSVAQHVPSAQLLNDIVSGLRIRYAALNDIRYDAAWSDSWAFCLCFHAHPILIEAAKCGMPQPGFYAIAIEAGLPRELTAYEDKIVDAVRFGTLANSANA